MSARTLLAAENNPEIHVPSVDKRVLEEYPALESNIGLAGREILALVYK
jgi:hypothetical protein